MSFTEDLACPHDSLRQAAETSGRLSTEAFGVKKINLESVLQPAQQYLEGKEEF